MLLYFLILGPIAAALFAQMLFHKHYQTCLLFFQLVVTGAAFWVMRAVHEGGEVLLAIGGWAEGVAITLLADNISSPIVLLQAIVFMALLLCAYGKEYFTKQFGFLLMVFQGTMMGIFLSGDLFNVFVLLEVTTVVVSILMIMYERDKVTIHDGIAYFFANAAGSIFFLLGIGYIYRITGLLDMRAIHSAFENLENSRALILPYAFMMTTVSMKTSILPLYSWLPLPRAHATPHAPLVVSAVLSGIYIKTGLYLFIRLQDMFNPYIQMHGLFFIIGFVTAVSGILLAVGQRDIKLMLAFSTVSQVGLITMGLNMNHPDAYWGSMYYLIIHAFFKTTLFLAAGMIYKEYGTRDIAKIRGVFRRMPWVASAMSVSLLAITGAPFFSGSIAKYMISHGAEGWLTTVLLDAVTFGTILYSVRMAAILFGNNGRGKASTDKLSRMGLWITGSVSILGGVFGPALIQLLFGYEINIETREYSEKALMYLVMIAVGLMLLRFLQKRSKVLKKIVNRELGFNGSMSVMTAYFLGLLAVLRWMY